MIDQTGTAFDDASRWRLEPLSAPSSWERWVDTVFAWLPYGLLVMSVALAQFESRDVSDRLLTVGLSAMAGIWTWATFTRAGRPTRIPQGTLRLYIVGFVIIAAVLVFHQTIFLIYGCAGFFHAALLRPWPLVFVGIGAFAFVVHSHIVTTESSAEHWALYLGVVAIQTLTTGAGLFAGERITEIADERRLALIRLEHAMEENAGLHDQLVVQAREAGILDERERMAGEIHDTIAQGLAGVITQIEATHQSWGDDQEMRRHLDTAAEIARQSLADARRSVRDIRPTELDGSRLPAAISEVARRWSTTAGVPVQFTGTGESRTLPTQIEVALLRAAQEALANVGKHAEAGRAGITLSFTDDSVVLDIRDDGVGFDTHGQLKRDSYGLTAMRRRVEQVDGEMHVESARGEGTAISVRVPTDASKDIA
ncbi:MAG: sensor histidine kinase [Acidimicrobiia bacterium]|nr:sensor histidine kinase [Acidimicrobiia bacterium]